MSTVSQDDNSTQQNRFKFQHFNKEFDFGIVNEEGERVRKRKKPGRKPNPPSLEEKRAQNRVAQKSFREREQQRRMEKEKERIDYNQKIKDLKTKLATVQFEARYLKACVLHLTLACLIHRGSAPHIWAETRITPTDDLDKYEVKRNPALLEILLKDECIVDFDTALFVTTQKSAFSNFTKDKNANNATASPDIGLASYQSHANQELSTLNKQSQEPKRIFPLGKPKTSSSSSSVSSPPQQDNLLHSPPSSSLRKQPSKCIQQFSIKMQQQTTQDIIFLPLPQHQNENSRYSPSTNIDNSQAVTVQKKPLVGVIFDPPSLKSPEDFIAMSTLQALHIIRMQLKLGSVLGNMITASLLPTALQRVIPHDHRIDYIPGAAIRDRMIIFQDYYNVDNCFEILTQNTVFVGGDLRDTRNWVIDPKYSMEYWFICHQLVDQTFDDCIDKEGVEIINKKYGIPHSNEAERSTAAAEYHHSQQNMPLPRSPQNMPLPRSPQNMPLPRSPQ